MLGCVASVLDSAGAASRRAAFLALAPRVVGDVRVVGGGPGGQVGAALVGPKPRKQKRISLGLVSYNSLSLCPKTSETGEAFQSLSRTQLLQRQMQDFHFVGVQEARSA